MWKFGVIKIFTGLLSCYPSYNFFISEKYASVTLTNKFSLSLRLREFSPDIMGEFVIDYLLDAWRGIFLLYSQI